jgi:gamma-glutamyl-gamma-aminobutyrate hydrolase PuuD
MLVAPPKGSHELEMYKQWLTKHNFKYTVLTPEITEINQPLLLCGGADVGVNKVRDQLEFNWIKSALENGQPIIGICRGMQLLNHYFGGDVENISEKLCENHLNDSFDDDEDHSHRLSQFHEVEDQYGNKLIVNSRHHQHCSCVPLNFEIIYRSKDGTVEGIEDVKNKIWAVQWHPERFESENNSIPLTYIMKQSINNL